MSAARTASPRLRELARRPAPEPVNAPGERCDLCAEPLADDHRHLLDASGGHTVLCACRACSLLFDRSEAGGRHYKLLPRRRLRLDGFTVDDALWASLGIPVGLAFFVRDDASGRTTVGYPSPLGTTRSELDAAVWHDLARGHPALAELAADVEALLVHRVPGAPPQHWIVPLDDCYRLVAVVRAHWKGLAGGPEVWTRIQRFFTGLARPEPAHR
ncbi:hypothetical protein BLA24_05025 [Streptomyces cinnamoneus]|uniref:Uncharacterized protein n=1 Tax=Streptomyces cinnamoneus TaxID=53446 RepID=A0A2G1XP45_STRCJ|nr:DUF5947 family protein [Streptomyces cinnamoneus]PHQ52983.1 hypothetical protein BLA24_05025 [Streptomyces cinnamoneus]PPT11504.1 hypothetical protein CYQ11_28505 [Streptomyces cinnamoneus]